MLGRPAEEKWKGKNGTIQLVCEILQLTPRKNYYRVVRKVLTSCAALKKGNVYYGMRKLHTQQRSMLSEEEKKQLANGLELNYGSLHDVTEDVNVLREGNGKESISVLTIWTAL